jgi:mRNA-degrading endonuclease RelE of RelBE toxin-antitoxin system
MAYAIELTDLAVNELKALRPFESRRLVDEINRQLTHQPTGATRNRKCLGVVAAGFMHVPPLWELRVGAQRIFYDVDEAAATVFIRAIRRKGPSQTTEEVLQ